jgi:hypothetical protein
MPLAPRHCPGTRPSGKASSSGVARSAPYDARVPPSEEQNVNLRIFRRVPARKRGLIAMLAAAVASVGTATNVTAEEVAIESLYPAGPRPGPRNERLELP